MSLTERTQGRVFRPVYQVFFGPARQGFRFKMEAKNILQITTQTSLSSPAGTFEIVLNYDPVSQQGNGPYDTSDRLEGGENQRWSDILAPNDYVEIWLGRIGSHPPKIVMRGWIDNVTVNEQAGSQGPVLRITINGRDYGKVWLVTKILNIDPRIQTVSEFIANAYNVTFTTTDLSQLFHEMLEKVTLPYLKFHQGINSIIPDFIPDSSIIDPDKEWLKLEVISPQNLLEVVYSVIQAFTAKPMLELFVRDDDDGPRYVIRWAATRTSDNKQLTGLMEPYPIKIIEHHINPIDDIVEDNLTRSDTDVFNWIRAYQVGQLSVQKGDSPDIIYPKKMPYIIGQSIDMYGLRRMTPSFEYMTNNQGAKNPDLVAANEQVFQLSLLFTLWCANMYGHDYALINGALRVKGLPIYKIGEDLVVHDKDGIAKERFYIEGVRHEFIYNQSYRTTLNVTRGMPVNGFPNGGLETMSPFSLPTSFPSDIGTQFMSDLKNDLLSGSGDSSPTPPSIPGKPS